MLICTLLVVAGLIFSVTRLRLPAFIGLLVASLIVGVCAGLSVREAANAFQEGVGLVLGPIALVIGLGTILGKLLAESGGAHQLADRLLAVMGSGNLPWTMLFLGFLVGIPVFFGVGLVLLAPILYAVRDETNTPSLHLAIPLLAGLSAAHGLVPPHPGPMAAIGLLKADAGKTVWYSLLIGAGSAIVAGPVLCRVCGFWKTFKSAGNLVQQLRPANSPANLPPFWQTLLTIVLPIVLMLLAAGADLCLPESQPVRKLADALGTPLGAMLLSVLVAFRVLGTGCGFDRNTILKFTEDCLAPIAMILLVVGAGGGFSRILVVSGAGTATAEFAGHGSVSPLILGWIIAALIRVATGSATVAISTAAGLVSPMAAATPGTNMELLVVAMGAGSLVLSHINDAGFWWVKEYLGLSTGDTLKSWTIMETVLSITALLLSLGLDKLIR
jgi:GntP family gluconate:H+ symporter